MPLQQGTFTLVPESLRTSATSHRPMSSKQVKRAHQKANKVSKLELKRIEKEELEAQKKEYERERAAAKAKAAREKKAEKERLAKEERKRKGIPEKSRWVRPSQPTITGFAHTRKRAFDTTSDGESDENRGHAESDSESSKRVRVIEGSQLDDVKAQKTTAMEFSEADSRADSEQKLAKPATMPKTGVVQTLRNPQLPLDPEEEDDEFGDFPAMTQSDLPRLFELDRIIARDTRPAESHQRISRTRSPSPEIIAGLSQCSVSSLDEDNYRALVDSQLLSEAADADRKSSPAITRTCQVEPANPLVRRRSPEFKKPAIPVARAVSNRQALSSLVAPDRSRIPLQENSTNKCSIAQSSTADIKRNQKSEEIDTRHFIPPSTMAFIENNIDDFFPSPSQEAEEMLSELDDFELPSNTQIAREIGDETIPSSFEASAPQQSVQAQTLKEELPDEFSFVSTQDFILSTQDIQEMNTPCKPPSRLTVSAAHQQPVSAPNWITDSVVDSRCSTPNPCTPRSDKCSTAHNLGAYPLTAADTTVPAPRQEKPRFFQEKDEDLLAAAIDASLKTVTKPKVSPKPRQLRSSTRANGTVQPEPKTAHVHPEPQIKRVLTRVFSATYGEYDDEEDMALLAMLEKVEAERKP